MKQALITVLLLAACKSDGTCPPGPDPYAACAPSCDPLWYRPATDEPCDYPTECAPSLACDYDAPPPSGMHCGSCRSNGSCPPGASPYACQNPSEPGSGPPCPPYIGKGISGAGCQWSAECANGLVCDLSKPQKSGSRVIYCGTCS